MTDVPAKAIRGRIDNAGRVKADVSLKGLAGKRVLIFALAEDATSAVPAAMRLTPTDPGWAELATLCGWTPEAMEQEFNRLETECDRANERQEFEAVSAIVQDTMTRRGIRSEAQFRRVTHGNV